MSMRSKVALTSLVHIVNGLFDILQPQGFWVVSFSDGTTAFGQYDKLLNHVELMNPVV